ncbi:MAG: Ribosomal large subunit pseudouridine synthase [Pseudomonadota bacterium]|jgi:23S rRNA pseudouridine2457 synthase
MAKLILLNKPFEVLSQFSQDGDKTTLAKYVPVPNVYPAGRLDYDSEGLLLLTDNGQLQHQIAHPSQKWCKTYWVQVEGVITPAALELLRQGVMLNDGKTLPAEAWAMPEPTIWPRVPPIRERKLIPTSWLGLQIKEGRNRQVRRMTAAVGFPTLRLIRAQIDRYELGTLLPGEYKILEVADPPPSKHVKRSEFKNHRNKRF